MTFEYFIYTCDYAGMQFVARMIFLVLLFLLDAKRKKAMLFKEDSLCQVCGCGNCTVKDWIQGKPCSSPIWDRYPDFILLDPSKQKQPPRSLRKQNFFHGETKNLFEKFKKCSKITWRCLNEEIKGVGLRKNLDVDDVATALFAEFNLSPSQASTMADLRDILKQLRVSWYNFTPIFSIAEEHLMEKYPEVKESWEGYCSSFKDYCKNRRISKCNDMPFGEEADDNVFILTVDDMYNDIRLSDIPDLRDSLCHVLDVPSASVHLVAVRVESVHFHFVYCLDDYITRFTLTDHQKQQLAALIHYKIISLTDEKNRFSYNFVS